MNEIKSQSPQELLNQVENFSRGKLNRKEDLKKIFEAAFNNSIENEIEYLSFNAKYVQGLFRVLKSGTENPDIKNIDQIKKDLTENMIKVKEQIKNLISKEDNSIKNYFEQNYFEMNQYALQNLNELLNDLEWTKMYLNSVKREAAN